MSRPRSKSFTQKVQKIVVNSIFVPAVGVFSTFVICIACFPGVSTSLRSHTLNLKSWQPIWIVFFYNVCDLIGKALPAYYMPFDGDTVAIPVVLQAFSLPIMVLEKFYDFGPDDKSQFHFVFAFFRNESLLT